MRLAILMMFLPFAAMAEVPQGAPNAAFAPEFTNQTRAPQLESTQITVTRFATGLSQPWGIASLPNGQFLVTEKRGVMRVIDADGNVSSPVGGVPPVADRGQGGLLDVAVSPRFAKDRLVYWTYAKPVQGGAGTAAARGALDADGRLNDVMDIFVQDYPSRSDRHFGSRIIPQSDGTVWITTGDRGAGDGGTLVQNQNTLHGKVVRVDAGGEVGIWSLGHRNIQGAALGPGGLWTVEHGPRGGDELNQPKAGQNYGWPLVSYGINYLGRAVGSGQATGAGFAPPVYYWDPVIAPSNMVFYDGPYTRWQGDILIGSLNPGGLVRLKLSGGRVVGEERLLPDVGRVRDVEVLSDGGVLVVTDDGDVLRVVPK